MTPEEAITRLKIIQEDDDTEQAHIDADQVLKELVPPEVRAEYIKIHKWYS